jgi:tetratricopeptide (TPR) repeat protein
LVLVGLAGPVQARDLAALREGIRLNRQGDYGAALAHWREMAARDVADPTPHVYAADTLFWRMLYDDSDTRFDAAIERECQAAIRKARASLEANSDNAWSHFLVGQALMHQGRLNGIRLHLYRAGSLGEESRGHLERALELEPGLVDAKFQLGLYAYYASLVPKLFSWFSFLWFIPKGDGDLGLQYLSEVYARGDLERFKAGFFLGSIQTYHDGRLDRTRALEIMSDLHRAHPRNPLVHFERIELLALLERHEDVIRETLILEAEPAASRERLSRRAMARVWRARAEMLLGRPEAAWEILEVFGPDGPANPNWGARWVQATRGQILDLSGERDAALAEYQRVAALGLSSEDSRATGIAEQGLLAPFARPPLPPAAVAAGAAE